MCGITGILGSNDNLRKNILSKMTFSLTHRGPDSREIWIDADNLVGLGHTRLAIIDLTKTGNQPMFSKNNRYVIVYNGEIYNHLEIKSKIEQFGQTKDNFYWSGIHINGCRKINEISFTKFSNLDFFSYENIQLTGSLNFYDTKVFIADSYFENSGSVMRDTDNAEWDGRDHLGQVVSPGTYIMHIEANQFHSGKSFNDYAPVVVGVRSN